MQIHTDHATAILGLLDAFDVAEGAVAGDRYDLPIRACDLCAEHIGLGVAGSALETGGDQGPRAIKRHPVLDEGGGLCDVCDKDAVLRQFLPDHFCQFELLGEGGAFASDVLARGGNFLLVRVFSTPVESASARTPGQSHRNGSDGLSLPSSSPDLFRR